MWYGSAPIGAVSYHDLSRSGARAGGAGWVAAEIDWRDGRAAGSEAVNVCPQWLVRWGRFLPICSVAVLPERSVPVIVGREPPPQG
ncbi:hypothetical protein Psuf_083440 [Phytohabitans suffuscus]|uniref:Uncharacterized protein n=1 Tax=Phytohabitans suffuscus TaxID=624315 RepID=A0A6F8YYW5_9ACTN|nr:hypothetical protein Psuf_083440 [Phytohabitans suffuscus]